MAACRRQRGKGFCGTNGLFFIARSTLRAEPADTSPVRCHRYRQILRRYVYVHADGIDLSAAPEIFTLEFKATGEGTTPISFEVCDCVDADVEFMQIGTCTSGSVTAEKDTKTDSAAAEKKSDHTSGSGQSRTKSGSSAKSQSADKTETETTKPTVPITVEKHDSGGDRAVAVAVLTVSVVGGMIFFSWFIPKLLKEHRAKKKLPSADTTDDKDRE